MLRSDTLRITPEILLRPSEKGSRRLALQCVQAGIGRRGLPGAEFGAAGALGAPRDDWIVVGGLAG